MFVGVHLFYTQIETLKKQKSAEINNERDNPKRLGLLIEKSLIKEELVDFYSIIETLVSKKDNLVDELNSLRDHIKNVKGKNAFRSMADIDHQRAIIEQKMMDTHYTNQQEKEYQAILLDLHKKKQSYGDLGGKEKRIHDLETALQSVKAQIKETSDDINLRKKEMEALNKVLDGTRNNKKSDKVAEIEKQIDALYDRKKELIENRRKEHEIIKQKEEEHAKYMEVMSKQIEAENQKKQQKLKITKMIEELTNLENERSKYDANKYETIIKEVEKKNLSVSLISMLGTEKLNIPRCDADYDALLKTFVDRKNEFEKGICDKVVELNGKIKDLEEGIVEEKKVLEAMPVTEVSLERRKIK